MCNHLHASASLFATRRVQGLDLLVHLELHLDSLEWKLFMPLSYASPITIAEGRVLKPKAEYKAYLTVEQRKSFSCVAPASDPK